MVSYEITTGNKNLCAPELIAPLESTGKVGRRLPITFSWRPARDEDGDLAGYSLVVWKETDGKTHTLHDRDFVTGTSLLWRDFPPYLLTGNERYFWKVVTIDEFDGSNESAETFITSNEGPVFLEKPRLLTVTSRERVLLGWRFKDPEGDPTRTLRTVARSRSMISTLRSIGSTQLKSWGRGKTRGPEPEGW